MANRFVHAVLNVPSSYIQAGNVYLVMEDKDVNESLKDIKPIRNSIFIDVRGRATKIFSEEYLYVNEEDAIKLKKIFEKSLRDSKLSTIFATTTKQLKNRKMGTAKKAEEVKSSFLTKTEFAVIQAIFENPLKGKAVKSTDIKMISVEADLSSIDETLDGVDAAKVCRKLHRAGLINYKWNEDKSRSVSVTQEGFDAIQLGVKIPKEKAPKAEKTVKEAKPKAEKKTKAVKETKPVEDMSEGQIDDELLGVPEGFEVKANPVAKVFNVTFSDGEKYRLKVQTAQEFKDVKENSFAEWEALRDLGELSLVD